MIHVPIDRLRARDWSIQKRHSLIECPPSLKLLKSGEIAWRCLRHFHSNLLSLLPFPHLYRPPAPSICWFLKRAAILEEKNRELRGAVQAALASLSSEKDAALEAAVVVERRRADSAEERAASAAARAAEAEEARMAVAMEIAAAQAEGRARSQGGDEQRRRFQEEVKRLRAREDGIVRAREEAEMLVEEERSRAAEEVRYGMLLYVSCSPPIYLFFNIFFNSLGNFMYSFLS